MNRNLSNKWAQINQTSSRGGLTGRDTGIGGGNLANTMRNTTTSTPGSGAQNLLNTSQGFKDRLKAKKFAAGNNDSIGATPSGGAETGTIG